MGTQWLDRNGAVVLDLLNITADQVWWLQDEELPTLTRAGSFEAVPNSSVTVKVGPDHLRAGNYTQKLRIRGRTQAQVLAALQQITAAALRVATVRQDGYRLPLVGFLQITRKWSGQLRNGGDFDVEFVPETPYWRLPPVTVPLLAGGNAVLVDGEAPVSPVLTLTASAPVVNPGVITAAGVTTWKGTLAAGQTLVIDAAPRRWAVALDGVDRRTALTGPQPLLTAGDNTVTLPAGVSGSVTFAPGVLMPAAPVAEVGGDIDWGVIEW